MIRCVANFFSLEVCRQLKKVEKHCTRVLIVNTFNSGCSTFLVKRKKELSRKLGKWNSLVNTSVIKIDELKKAMCAMAFFKFCAATARALIVAPYFFC